MVGKAGAEAKLAVAVEVDESVMPFVGAAAVPNALMLSNR
jgi:hypothetical protein